MSKDSPIGIFDSGVGGTSIWKEIHDLLPLEHTIYLADSQNAPYGEKPAEEIVRLSVKNTEKLLQMGAKIIVVACNTATTNAIQHLRSSYTIPFIGIEPAIKPAALNTRTKSIGILATKGTLTSALFAKTSDLYSRDNQVVEVVGKGLVEQIENGQKDAPQVEQMLRQLLRPMLDAGIDYLVLGCSHYPYLIPTLKKILPAHVTIIDSGMAVAKQTKHVLQSLGLLSDIQLKAPEFFTNGNLEVLRNLLPEPQERFEVSHLEF
ncbi:glutamate racemase [Salinimicrobium oceani]|uniref:Glutamate racemase n=1 Tax=Salinimicrobium oceani TaxID=2722702 RepID=A0ABX1CZD9_9FLAO|nr:glutamate racemase [Salinimicrobium oceani]NJW53635.1 glutamate racemase [Salinimicrobium oceani]